MNTMTTLSSRKYSLLKLCIIWLLFSHSLFTQANHLEHSSTLPLSIFQLKTEADDTNIIKSVNNPDLWINEKRSLYLNPNEGLSWLKIVIKNPDAVEKTELIEIAAAIKSVDLYRWDKNSPQQIQNLSKGNGYDHSFNQRKINYRNMVYTLTVPAHSEVNYLLKIEHPFGQRIQIQSWKRSTMQAAKIRESIFFGMIYGALFLIIIYNFFIYISTHERNHLFFSLFGAFSGVFITMHEGHFAQFIAPDSDWPKATFYAIVSAIMCFCFTFFCIAFLDLERRSKLFYRIMLSTGSITAITLIILGMNSHPIIFSHYTLLIIIALYIPAIAAGFYSRYNGVPTAGYFSLAIFVCTLGLSLDFLSSMEFINLHRWAYSYTSMGYTAMIMVFALSLADKMRQLNEDKLATTIELVKLTEEKAQSNIEVYKSKLNEVQLEQQADEAKIESRAKSEFLATMSHEIRTPMNGILGMTELLADTELNQQQHQFVSSITKSAKTLLNVINDLLDYSKIESGKIELEAKVFNLEKIIDDCISIAALKASETKLDFIGRIAPGTELQLKGDAPKIRQITLSLLNNAFNYAQGKKIYLNVMQTKKKSVNSIEIRVEINCPDTLIDGHQQHAILNPFKNKTDHKNKGQELGLTVSKQLVDMMHGRLGIECDEEKNETIFWFTARLLEPHENEKQVLVDRSKHLNARRLLICDPNEDFMASVKDITESWGMHCSTVNNTRDVADKLINDKNSYQVLMIEEECLTPEVQLAVRKSNVDHNFNTSVMLTCKSRFKFSDEDMKKRGIQSLLETPYTTALLYQTLLKSMGIAQKEEQQSQKPLSVLVAEDNSVNQMVIDGLLKKLNIIPVVTNNGQEAVDAWMLQQGGFDLILMDCEMPELDGYEATHIIR
ncbi:MAG: response regulator, partial [Pseudomonadales bacterium]|nr:response regulator [Pseudomonadales bacterium]